MKRLAVVIASAECWKRDWLAFCALHSGPRDVYAVNDAAWLYDGPLSGLATLHPENLSDYLRGRTDLPLILSKHKEHMLSSDVTDLDYETFGHWGSGSSTLFAVSSLLEKGYTRILLCGAPMDASAHADGASTWDGKGWGDYEIHREGWEHHKAKLGCVRSMSGWTRELLGGPDPEFLYDSTPVHAAMAQHTVVPFTKGGAVAESFWHCVACGDTGIYEIRSGVYHCTSCGRDFTASIQAVPWYAHTPENIRSIYPAQLWSEDGNR